MKYGVVLVRIESNDEAQSFGGTQSRAFGNSRVVPMKVGGGLKAGKMQSGGLSPVKG
jgi:hypothetical protein